MKKVLKIVLIVLLALVVLVGGYVAYVFLDYHRIGDQTIEPEGAAAGTVETGAAYGILSWNIGFGAYTEDYDFFMDGGTQSWAESPERLERNLGDIADTLRAQEADFYLIQEVDIGATRTYQVDERPYIVSGVGDGFAYTFAQNYDSPFLFYPLTQPHGASRAGLMTFSSAPIAAAERVELPIERGFMKLVDLDRCYSVQRIPLADAEGELVLYNLHLSAYTSDGTIATEQLKLLCADMTAEFEKCNWCVAGGDFNKDLLGNSAEIFGVAGRDGDNWAKQIPAGTIPDELSLIAPSGAASCRTPDAPYDPETAFRVTVDGFLVTPNVSVAGAEVVDTGFAYSDHNPVRMTFTLEP